MNNKKLEVLKFVLRKILSQATPKKIILFGSAARGDLEKDSDIDLAIEPEGEGIGLLDIIGNVDIVNLKNVSEKIKENILKEGIIVYEEGKILI